MNDDELKDLFDNLDDKPEKKESSKDEVSAPSKSSSETKKTADKKNSDKKAENKDSADKIVEDKKTDKKSDDSKSNVRKFDEKKLDAKAAEKVEDASKKFVSEPFSKREPAVKKSIFDTSSTTEQKKDINKNIIKTDVPEPKKAVKKDIPDPKLPSNSINKTSANKTSSKTDSDKSLFDIESLKRKVKASYIRITSEPKHYSEEEKLPLSEREYLKNFPLSFKNVLVILLVATLIVAFMCFLFFPQFRVMYFVIDGNITISDAELIEQSGIELNSHLFSNISGDLIDVIKCDYGKIEDQMKDANPYIKDIQISASFPSTIKMSVVERNKIAYVKMPDGYAAIDEDGTVIELTTILRDDASHAVICGLDVSCAIVDEKINIKNETDYQKAIVVLGAILASDINGANADEYMMFENTKEIRIIPGGNIFLTIVLPSESELQVKLKDVVDINEDMAILRRAIIMDTFEGLPNGSFDMTGEEYVYRKAH